MSKWPDGTRKSTDNAFNWRDGRPSLHAKQTQSDKVSQALTEASAKGKAVGKAITIRKKK
jgi:hypothetical protein